jgi:hypothetical protein
MTICQVIATLPSIRERPVLVNLILVRILTICVLYSSYSDIGAHAAHISHSRVPFQPSSGLPDIAPVAEAHVAEPGERMEQFEVLNHINATTINDPAEIDAFNQKRVYNLKLSHLRRFYENRDPNVLNLLQRRNRVVIDNNLLLTFGQGQILMNTKKTMLDYQLTVANCMGFATLLPNAANAHWFFFNMDLQKPYKEFRGKHAMVGFDTKGRLLYLGRSKNEDVYLAMAPTEFLLANFVPCHAGYSTGSSTMSQRHYRQIVMMLAHFLANIPELAYSNIGNVYDQDLEDPKPVWSMVTNIMYVSHKSTALRSIRTVTMDHGYDDLERLT